jgi:hypothetical protein
MKSKVAIYLAGSIKKGHESSNESYWTDEDMELLKKSLFPLEVSFLNPAFRTDDLGDQRSVFGRDMVQVFSSDIVFVDARDRRGLGVGAEMMWAKFNRTPVLVWAPKNSHYHKSHTTILGMPVANFIHPFVEGLGDKIVEDLVEGAAWIKKVMSDPSIEIKGVEQIRAAMLYYREHQLGNDAPMQVLLAANQALKERVEKAHFQAATL